MKYSYYPGCSLEKNAAAYHESTMAVAGPLGIEFVEVDDWNCCGATEYASLNQTAAYSLIARNLALATKNEGLDTLVAPCSACYLNLRKCDKYMATVPALAGRVDQALAEAGLSYTGGSLHVRHLLDVIYNDVGLETLQAKTTKPLKGLRVAPYYGCMIVRPGFHNGDDDTEYPVTLDRILGALGAEVVDYPMKAHCCGGHMTQISEATGFELIRRLIKGADDYQADVIAVICPMCQLNLDGFQGAMNRHFGTSYHVPVLYFTQLIGLAMGISPKELGIGQELVSAAEALEKIGAEAVPAEAAPRRKRDDKALPMPGRRGEG
jgi:heterodisulfide reductase subunit B2